MADMIKGLLGQGDKKPPPQMPTQQLTPPPTGMYQFNPAVAQAAIRQAFGLTGGQ